MKRSHMIEIMAKRLGPVGIGYPTIEEVLDLMLEAGMLPPQIVNPKYKDRFSSHIDYAGQVASHKAHGSKTSFEEYHLNQWESEDEER